MKYLEHSTDVKQLIDDQVIISGIEFDEMINAGAIHFKVKHPDTFVRMLRILEDRKENETWNHK